jgi:glycogen debranching enzyme
MTIDTRMTGGHGSAERGHRAVAAQANPGDERTRVLKHGDTFAVFDHRGDITPPGAGAIAPADLARLGGFGEQGLYHGGTRFLSQLQLDLEGTYPLFLDSTVRDDNDQLTVALTNPDLLRSGLVRFPLGTLQIAVRKFLWDAVCYQQFRVSNHGLEPIETSLSLHFRADFADIYEIRGLERRARGEDLAPEIGEASLILGYRGLDEVVRRTHISCAPRPDRLAAGSASVDVRLLPQQELVLSVSVACERQPASPRVLPFEMARAAVDADVERSRARTSHVRTSNAQFDRWIARAEADLYMMTTELPTGPYPYAGVPWLNAPFGRDGIVTALECLWLSPALARGVLMYLAATQAAEMIPEQDAEPGKILHETRQGEMAALKEMPFGRYYGSVDATPLFVLLAGAYYERTGDHAFVGTLWPHVESALGWIDRYGDRDGDGFVEYSRQTPGGLLHQGWKDSDDAVFHADGSLAAGPIAPCEVQGYVYAARRAAARLARLLGMTERAEALIRQANELRARFDKAFWCQDLSTYALALDGAKRPCQIRSSNAGQCLFTGIVDPQRAARVVDTLLNGSSYSGWGVRTVAATEARYNPMSYHNGSIWPHDNALIALGLASNGFGAEALQMLAGLYEAGLQFDLNRMPELFGGFQREAGERPVPYPVACAPQAWSAASAFLLVQAALGLWIDGVERRVYFSRPRLPHFVDELRILDLDVAGETMDIQLVRHQDDVRVSLLRRADGVRIVVVK